LPIFAADDRINCAPTRWQRNLLWVQAIYYTGFTAGGFAEVLNVIAAALLRITWTQSAGIPREEKSCDPPKW